MQTLKQIVEAQIAHIETDFVPYNLLMEQVAIDKLTKYFGSTDWMNNLLPCIKSIGGTFDSWDTMQPYDPERPWLTIDAYGNIWDNHGAISQLARPGLDGKGLDEYKWPTLDRFLTEEKKKRMYQMAVDNPNSYRIAEAGAGHYELTWRLFGVEEALVTCIADPDYYDEVVENLDILINQFVDECLKLPVEAVMLFDDWCDQRTCTMGPDRWRQFIKPRLAKIYDKIHKAGKKAVNHVCGSVECLIPDLIEIGLDILEPIQPEANNMNPYELKKKYGNDLVFWGGLGVQNIVTFGTPEDNQAEIRRLRREMSVNGGYILSPNKQLNSTVPVENLVAIYNAFIEENYKYGLL